jgi:hypothetical protein
LFRARDRNRKGLLARFEHLRWDVPVFSPTFRESLPVRALLADKVN